MTIRPNINASELNTRLGYIEDCAREAPEGTYELAKATAEAVSDCAVSIMDTIKAAGLKVVGDDSMREVEAVIYGYIARHNADALATAEGFGENLNGPARKRIIAQAAKDRDALRALMIRGIV